MPTLKEIVAARLSELGLTSFEAERAVDLKRGFIYDILNDKKASVRGPYLVKLAQALDCDPALLLGATRPKEPKPSKEPPAEGHRPPPQFFDARDTMPVYSAAEGGAGTMIVDFDPIEYVPRPYTLELVKDAYGILVTGESMVPAFRPGDIAWVNPRLSPMRDTDVILYGGIEHGEPRASIKELTRWTEDKWFLRQWNPPEGQKPEFTLNRKDWPKCHRVVGKFSRR